MIDHWREETFWTASQEDMDIYESMIPEDHKLCGLVHAVNFEAFRPIVEGAYSTEGQPTGLPMITFKLEVIKYFYNLSDRAVVERSRTDVAFRWFLKMPMAKWLSDHTIMTRFRGRLGKERYEQMFQELVSQARKAGVVKDQLRLKDASHILANISIPSTMALVSQIRQRLLGLIGEEDAEAAAGYELAVQTMRENTKDASDPIRLNERVELLVDILAFAKNKLANKDELIANRTKLQEAVELAESIVEQKKEPKTKRKVRSVVDPDARRGKHGEYYDGYTLDISMDADSEIITAINVIEAGASEAESAITLIEQERSAQGNAPKELSMDGAGNSGPMIRTLESEEMNMQVYTPPKKTETEFGPEKFEVVETDNGKQVKCPKGQISRYSQKDRNDSCTIFRFPILVCQSCDCFNECTGSTKESTFGRSVRKSDYQPEYDRIRNRSETERFKEVRKLHPAVERKLNEIVNHHGARRARYRGHEKVPIQMFGVGLAVNMKRLIKLVAAKAAALVGNEPSFQP